MASKNIKGITIEIGGNTTKLTEALKDVNKVVYTTNQELKDLNKALKLDPKNTELLAQKQELLQKNIQASTERLNALKEAQRQMGDYNHLTEEQKENYRALSVEIAKSESAINGMNDELKGMNKVDLSGITEGLKKAGEVAVKVAEAIATSVLAISVAIGKLVKDAVNSYASYEQNVGGVETLFKKSADIVIKNAQNAYKTAGISANQYMENVTSFSASLLKSLKNDTTKAAKYADTAMIDMADNANKFGTNIESIQHAYQGFAKGQYNMLDNLKLGYGGTKKEMQRLLKDASKLAKKKFKLGNFADEIEAIHVIQKSLGIAGTTAKEAEETISGSLSSMKASFDNFLNGSGGVEELSGTISTFLKNVLNAIKKLAPGLLKGIVDLFNDLIPQLASMASELLPIIIDGAKQLIEGLINFINNDSEQFIQMAIDLLMNLVTFILENLPLLLEATIKIIAQLAKGIADEAPTLVPVIVDCLILMVETLIDNLDLLVDASIELILALADGLIDALPRLIEKLPEIVKKIVKGLIENAPKVKEAGIELTKKLIEGMVELNLSIFNTGYEMGKQFVQGLLDTKDWIWEKAHWLARYLIYAWEDGLGIGSMYDSLAYELGEKTGESFSIGVLDEKELAEKAGKDVVNGLKAGIDNKSAQTGVVNSAKKLASNVLNAMKNAMQIKSPSKATAEMGVFLDEGLINGIKSKQRDVERASNSLGNSVLNGIGESINVNGVVSDYESAMSGLSKGVEASLNPTINPTANSNPLYITIDKFYNNRDTDIRQLAEELEFYRKNSALAKGGV